MATVFFSQPWNRSGGRAFGRRFPSGDTAWIG